VHRFVLCDYKKAKYVYFLLLILVHDLYATGSIFETNIAVHRMLYLEWHVLGYIHFISYKQYCNTQNSEYL